MLGHDRRAAVAALGLALLLPIAGCSKSDPPAAAAAARPAQPAKPADATVPAKEVARQSRGKLSCPARIDTPARPAAAPVDDVLGVRPGLSYEEAMGTLLCTHELLVASVEAGRGFTLKAAQANTVRQGFAARMAEDRVARSSKQILQDLQRDAMARGANAVREDLQPGQAKWFVGTMGLPGQERVLSVAREERFAVDQSPTLETVTAALLKKYGTPSFGSRPSGSQLPVLRWAYDPQGRPVAEGSALQHRCIGSSDPNGGLNLSPDCGLVVQAMLIPLKSNPALVDRMQVGVVDHAGGYRMITETEQGLGQLDQQRRTMEIDKASKNAKTPTL
jgi:hypothetical protein